MAEEHADTTLPVPRFCSTAQMDNFYTALAGGTVKATGVMNCLQHLFIAERCPEGAAVLDVCCGRGLQVPLLKRYAPTIGCYVGVDISQANLEEADTVIRYGDGAPPTFPCTFLQGDVCVLTSLVDQPFDIVIYTSALEHLERDAGIASLEQVVRVLTPRGVCYLSTPRTEGLLPRPLQHRVHLYEWGRAELEQVLATLHLTVIACLGLLPPDDALLADAIARRFGEGALAWFRAMHQAVPQALLAPMLASSFPEVATELLFVCQKGP